MEGSALIDPQLMLDIIRQSPIIAYDTESTGLTVKDKVCGYVVTDHSFSLYTPVRHEAGGNIPDVDDFERELNRAFADRHRLGYRTVGHHLGFDLRISLRHGVKVLGPLEDTMINESLIYDLTVGYSLENCAKRRNVTHKKGAELYVYLANRFGGLPDKKQMGNFWKVEGDHPLIVEYATGDGVSTLELYDAQQPLLDEHGVRKPWKLECDLLPYLARMHNRGLLIDAKYAERVVDDVEESLKDRKAVFSPGFNARSPKEVEELYRRNGFSDKDFDFTAPSPTKPQGQVSFTEKWLETNEVGDAILSVRRLEKARDSFITPLIDTHNIDGRVHPILNQSKSDEYGVAGSRLSCSEPNMQAFPKRNMDVGRIVRRLVIADDDWLFEEADFKQQEPRFFTHYSEEAALIHGYKTGEFDIHDRANEVLALDNRDTAKRLGLGMLTMMTPKTLAMHMRCDINTARDYHRRFLTEAFPAIGDFQQTAIAKFKSQGFVRSILGRKAHMDSSRFAYKAVSRIIQNSGGDHMKTALLRACQYEDAYSDKINILLSIHDSTIWQRDPDHDITELRRVIEGVAQESDFDLIVPIPVDLGSGRDWARASYGSKLDKYEKQLDAAAAE